MRSIKVTNDCFNRLKRTCDSSFDLFSSDICEGQLHLSLADVGFQVELYTERSTIVESTILTYYYESNIHGSLTVYHMSNRHSLVKNITIEEKEVDDGMFGGALEFI